MKTNSLLLLLFCLSPLAYANLSLSKTLVSFYSTPLGSSASDQVDVMNLGAEAVQVSVTNACYLYDFQIFSGCYLTVNPSGRCSISIQFVPRSENSQSCSIQVTSSKGDTQTIDVNGKGFRR